MKALFVTGTDTGCGKTQVGISIALAARARGLRVRVCKPVETGCATRNGSPVPADAHALAQAADDSRPIERICPYRLELPAAPSVAALAEGVKLAVERLEAAFRDAAQDADLVLVEGAGGLRVPICPELDMAGLAARLDLPLLVVGRAALGTWNHTTLTLDAAAQRGLRVLGVIVNHTTASLDPGERQNLDQMLRELPVPCFGELPYTRPGRPAADAKASLALLDAFVPA